MFDFQYHLNMFINFSLFHVEDASGLESLSIVLEGHVIQRVERVSHHDAQLPRVGREAYFLDLKNTIHEGEKLIRDI